MPLSVYDNLLNYAREKEKEKRKEKEEVILLALWSVKFLIDSFAGNEPMSYEDFINEENTPKITRNADEVMAEFLPIINAEREGFVNG